jgi:hypothetical protein
LVKWLFEVLAPTIRLEAAKLERLEKPSTAKNNTSVDNGADLLEAFEDGDEDKKGKRREF